MSRIHEALKKAEQERAVAQGASPDLNPLREIRPVDPAPTAVMDRPAVPGYSQPAVPRPADGASSGLTEDMLLARCARPAWKADPKTMLFFGSEENLEGMEQFRTLRARLYAARAKMPLKTVLVASALPKDGKSFVAQVLCPGGGQPAGPPDRRRHAPFEPAHQPGHHVHTRTRRLPAGRS